jgi:hypothetical protein
MKQFFKLAGVIGIALTVTPIVPIVIGTTALLTATVVAIAKNPTLVLTALIVSILC